MAAMTFLTIFVIFIALVLLGEGILFLLNDRWMPKLEKIMTLTPRQSSAISRIGVWKLRSLGVSHIVVSIFIFIAITVPDVGPSLPFTIAFIPLLAYVLLGWVMVALSLKNRKTRSKKS
jgi:hypothetical protein